MHEKDRRRRGHKDYRRTRKRVERSKHAQKRRYEHVVFHPEQPVLCDATGLIGLLQDLMHLKSTPAPQGYSQAEENRTIATGHVGIAECGEEEDVRVAAERTPQWPGRTRKLLDEAQNRQGDTIPYDHFQKRALAGARKTMLCHKRGRKRRDKPHYHMQVPDAIDAKRQEGKRRSSAMSLGYERLIAVWAKPRIDKRYQKK